MIDGNRIIVTGQDAKHLKVLRLKKNEQVRAVCGSTGMEYLCEFSDFTDDDATLTIVDAGKESRELPVKITLFQGLPKSDKMEFVIQKAVEMGAVRIVPVIMKRSIVKVDEGRINKKLDRWNAIAKSASEQSMRNLIPAVESPMTFEKALEDASHDDAVLMPYELAENMDETRKILESLKTDKIQTVSLFVGPEGGIDASEVKKAEDTGAKLITLGRRILRTETAPLAILAWLTYLFEE